MNTNDKAAAAAYKKAISEARSNINRLNNTLKMHEAKQKVNAHNWGFAGDIGYINEKLTEALTFINSNNL